MQKSLFTLAFCLLAISFAVAQTKSSTATKALQPKLVVGIVVDQMRYDYLYRYYSKYSEGGLKRLMNEGFNCRNHHYDYTPTVTAAGHAAIFTGSVPAIDGIVGNEWYSQKLGRAVYCVEDSTVQTVGNDGVAGKMSPRNLLVSTITDQLHIANNFKSKVIGISLKDRGSILPAGHSANGAYWFDSKDGAFITSTFYMNELPQWVKDFNAQKLPQKYIAQGWKTILPIEQYTESTPDDQDYEAKLVGETKPVFPHEILGTSTLSPLETFRATPWGNTITKDFALAAIKNENLGKGQLADFLTVSFSSTDYIGHAFGPNSIEAEDGMLRLDKDLAEMLDYLDTNIGKGNYLVFLSADHGVADVAGFSKQHKVPAGVADLAKISKEVKEALQKAFGDGEYISSQDNYQLYLNYTTLSNKKITVSQVYDVIRATLVKEGGYIADVVNLHDLRNSTLPDYQLNAIKNGYNPRRSGDIQLILEANWYSGRSVGTTHGVSYRYDTHVPFLLYGWGIKKGETSNRTNITDISPTIADLLSILEPNGAIGKPVVGVK